MRNVGLFAAGGLFVFTSIVHAWLGGSDVATPIDASALPLETRATAMAAWHLLTWHFLVFGAALLWMGRGRDAVASPVLVAAVATGDALIFLVIGVDRFQRIDILPQWTLFAAILVCLALGGWRWRRG